MRRLNCHKLLASLNSLCEFLDQTYRINHGGCCFLAYLIAKHLDRLGLEYDLIIYDNIRKHTVSIRHEVINCRKNKRYFNSVTGMHTCGHYCIQLKGAGIINSDDDEVYKYVIPGVSCKNIRWIYRNGDWNEAYNVRHNKTIKNIVKEFFKEYEKIPFHEAMYLS